jgi:alkylation response protein AidB-like acyl-CoA dehydrogenase
MDFNLTDEQQMLRDAVRRFAQEQYTFEARRRLIESGSGCSKEHWKSFAELGWLALGLPEDVGGLNCSFVETALLMEEFGRALVLEPYASSAILCARIVDASERREHRETLLPSIADGKLRLALAHSEAEARYNLATVQATTAKASGDGYVLDGLKTLAFDAPTADQLIVSAQVDGGLGLFAVPNGTKGVSIHAYPLIDGTQAADVELKAVRLPAAALLIEPARALPVLEEAIDRTVLAQVAEALGAMEAVLEITNAYIKQRVQFGQPIGKFQALQHRMAEMFVEVQETRSILYRGMALLDAAPLERKRAISAAKVVASNAAKFVGAQGIQLHGGIGMTEEYAVGHYYKKLIAFEKRYGDTEFHVGRYLQNEAR